MILKNIIYKLKYKISEAEIISSNDVFYMDHILRFYQGTDLVIFMK
jgi:hypothetical protein